MSWQKKLLLFVLVGLLAGCTALNKLLEEPFTGPSWDVSFDRIPLLLPQTFAAQDLLEDLLGDEQTEDEPIALKVDLGDILNFAIEPIEIPAIRIEDKVPSPGSSGYPYDGMVTSAAIEIDVAGLNWVKFAAGQIEISLENKTDKALDKLIVKLVDSDDTTELISNEIENLGIEETGILCLDLANIQLPKEFNLELWLETTDIGTGSFSFSASVTDLEWAQIAIDIDNCDFNLALPGDEIEIGLDKIGELLQGITIDPDAIEFNLQVSNPTNMPLVINLPAGALDSDGNLIGSSTIAFEVKADAHNETVSVTGLGELINTFPHSIRFSEAELFTGVNEVIIHSGFDFTMAMDLKINFILSIPSGGATHRLDPEMSDLSGELGNITGSWIREAELQFDITNHFPLGLEVTIFLSNEEDPYSDANAYTAEIGLPETLTDENGKVIREKTDTYKIKLNEDSLRIFREPFYVGLEIKILNTLDADKTAAFYIDDWVELSLWGNIGVRINPQDS